MRSHSLPVSPRFFASPRHPRTTPAISAAADLASCFVNANCLATDLARSTEAVGSPSMSIVVVNSRGLMSRGTGFRSNAAIPGWHLPEWGADISQLRLPFSFDVLRRDGAVSPTAIPGMAMDQPVPAKCVAAPGAPGAVGNQASAAASGGLPERLYALGLSRSTTVTPTRNRTVMLSWRPISGLRLHAGYAGAPDTVLLAIVRYLGRRVPRAERMAARRTFMAFPVDQHAPSRMARPRRVPPIPPEDQPLVDRLHRARDDFNARHFGGTLPLIPIRLSYRMRRRLGELRATRSGAAAEIVISRRHARRDPWETVADTLLHELVHQWQAENGHPLDHGREFRRKAKEVGIQPKAVADLNS